VKLARDFLAYNLVAAGSAAVDWATFVGLRSLGLGHLSAQGAARIAGGLFSFSLNKKTMEDGRSGTVVQGRRFLLLYAVSMALSIALLYLQVDVLGFPLIRAKVVADGTCFLVNFVAMRGYVFKATEGVTRRLRRTAVLQRWIA
jgi:putative flippase GtrA